MKSVVGAALLACACISVAKAQDTIRVGWTIPAEESKYWMMRRPEKFPNLGKGYKIEWSQFQGTSPMAQALIAGALDCATQGVLPIAQGMAVGINDGTGTVQRSIADLIGAAMPATSTSRLLGSQPVGPVAMAGAGTTINVFALKSDELAGLMAQAERGHRAQTNWENVSRSYQLTMGGA